MGRRVMAEDEEREGNGKPNGNNAEIVPLVHKVEDPHTRSDFAIIGSGLYDFFVHDAPLDQFKANGLYSSFVPPLACSVFGRSRDIAIGPVAVVSLLLGTLLKQEISPTDNPEDYLNLAFTATFFCGVFQIGWGVFRLGFVTKFLSYATIVGFMAGAAVTTALQQLQGLLNITHFTSETDFISVMKSVFGHIDGWNWRSILIGLAFLGFLIATKILVQHQAYERSSIQLSQCQKKKKLFWVSAIAPLTYVILSTLFLFLTRVDKHGVKIVGHIKKGADPVSAHQFFLSGSLAARAKTGLIASLIALTEGVAIGRTFTALRDYHIDGNKEMIAFGVMNLCGSVTLCYIASGVFLFCQDSVQHYTTTYSSPWDRCDECVTQCDATSQYRWLLRIQARWSPPNLHDPKFLAHLGCDWFLFTMRDAMIQVCTMLLNQAAAERQV